VRTLAIIGSHPRTREAFDFNRTDADVWLFNEAYSNKDNVWAKRADAVFQLHDPIIWTNPKNRNDPKHYDWLKSTLTTVYMQSHYDDVPSSVAYPLDEIKTMAGSPHFLISSVSMAIALGIHQGYDRIEIYGVAMETDTEYRYQRDGVSFWMGYARGRGIEIVFADTTFDAPIYGYEGEVSLDYSELTARVEELQAEQARRKQEYLGVLSEAQNAFADVVNNGGDGKSFIAALQKQIASGARLAEMDGAVQENQRYIGKANAMRDQSGDFIFSRQEFEQGAANAQKAAMDLSTQATASGGRVDHLFTTLARTSKLRHRRKRATEFIPALNDYIQKTLYAALWGGVMQENMRWMSKLDKSIRAAGGAKSETVMLERLKDGMVEA